MNIKDTKDRHGNNAGIIVAMDKAIRVAIDIASKSCLNCMHFEEAKELCGFKGYNQRPPARVIVTGCPSHEDEIPF